jgi:hypothetical protein
MKFHMWKDFTWNYKWNFMGERISYEIKNYKWNFTWERILYEVKFHMWKISHEVKSEISYVRGIHIKLQAKFHMWFNGFHMNVKKWNITCKRILYEVIQVKFHM